MERRYTWMIVIGIIVLGIIIATVSNNDGRDPLRTCFVDNGTMEYSLLDLSQCSAARFTCEAGKEYFSDSCGCGCRPIEENNGAPTANQSGKKVPIYCTDESRSAEACTMQYDPVCGWFDPSDTQCVTYPCAIEASNSCVACQNPDILYYTEGFCPSGGP